LATALAPIAYAASPALAAPAPRVWGTYLRPFAADSLWNSRPIRAELNVQVIPPSKFPPTVTEGAFSSGVFLANASDGPVTVTGFSGGPGLFDADAETHHDVTLPRWPADVVPASGSDGHADIIDPISGIVHSFFQLRHQNGQWVATQYAWTALAGRGWGDPAHYFQGSRAAAVPPAAGLIRTHEVNDGDAMYRHALAVSLTFNGLAADPAYEFPATSADAGAATTNSGDIPEGALLMLPYGFDVRQIANPALRKVAQTLKTYGAYVVDRNDGVPFQIYVENGSGFDLATGPSASSVAADLETIRLALRQVKSVNGWIDGLNRVYTAQKNLNLLSMRGAWEIQSGTAQGSFETLAQAVLIPEAPTRTVLANFSNRGLNTVSWAATVSGAHYRLTAITTGDASLRLALYDQANNNILFDSGELVNGASVTFAWPLETAKVILYAASSAGQASTVSGELLRVD
jgi:hypothetical protein